MRWPSREVALGVVVAGAVNLLPGCGAEFVKATSIGGDANAGSAHGGSTSGSGGKSGGASSTGGKAGSVSGGAGGTATNAGAGGSSGSSGNAGSGDGGDTSMSQAGAAGGGTVACEVELLTNGGLDTLNAGWLQMADPSRGLVLHQSSDILIDIQDQPVSPEYMLLLGGVDSDSSTVSQQINVPEGALSLAVSFYLHIHTEEDQAQIYDSVTLELSTSATDVVPVASYTNLDANEQWEAVSFQLDATSYRGTPTFVIGSQTDVGGLTHFMFDSFSITATLCED
jgi:hypothetical protein